MINYNIIVKGKVQGVWFRKYTQDIAYNLSLKGFVRNCSDGSVFIEVEGEKDKLNFKIYDDNLARVVTDQKIEIRSINRQLLGLSIC